MKIIKKQRENVAKETVVLELTIAEIAVLATCVGENSSAEAAEMAHDEYDHAGITESALEDNLASVLYGELDSIVTEAIGE